MTDRMEDWDWRDPPKSGETIDIDCDMTFADIGRWVALELWLTARKVWRVIRQAL